MTSKDLRARARQSLYGHWFSAILTAALACLLGGVITGMRFLPDLSVELPLSEVESTSQLLSVLAEQASKNSGVYGTGIGLLAFVGFILGGTIEIGYADFLLQQHEAHTPTYEVAFSAFDRFGTGFVQKLLRSIYIFLWSLLFVFPGIVAAYRYAMTPFILAENPELTASEAIARSKEMMNGHKGALFLLDLSFIGWAILAALPWNLGNLLLNPYRGAAHAAFYRSLQGRT